MSKTSEILKELKAKKHVDVDLLSSEESPCNVTEWLSTGCLALDTILAGGIGKGGLPVGRITEMYGENSSGKSLIASQVAGIAQANGATVCYIDTESASSLEMMTTLGVDVNNLIYSTPDTLEEVFTLCDDLVEAKEKADPNSLLVIIWDSIAATSAKIEIESDPGKGMYGRHALLLSQGFRRFCRVIAKKRVCLLALNQTRQKIGVMYGSDVTTFGGKALSFYASLRVELDVVSKISIERANKKKHHIGVNTKATVTKNKVAVPFREATLPIYFGSGISDSMSTFLYLQDNELFTRKGNDYHIVIGEQEIVSTKKDWPDMFDTNYDVIANFILNHKPDMLS